MTTGPKESEKLNRREALDIFAGDASATSSASKAMRAAASAAMVNRTHRVVRERAATIQARRSKVRSLWIPLTMSGALLAVIVTAIWSVLDQYELEPTGLPDASQQMFVLVMWCLPLSALLLAVVWLRRNGAKTENGSWR